MCEDERVEEYWKKTLSRLDISKAINDVETKIGVVLPENVRKMATACFNERLDAMDYRIPSDRSRAVKEQKNNKEDIIL